MVTAVGHRAWMSLRQRARPLDEARLAALSPLLVIAPHPDDETLGCGGLLASAADLNLKPRVAYLTDGDASHTGSPSWPGERLARVRRAEALKALSCLGVPRLHVCFLGWSDADPYVAGQPGYVRTLARLTRWAGRFTPKSLWSPWRGERHCDHVAAADLAIDLAGRLARRPILMDYMVWGWSEPALARDPSPAWALDCPRTIPARRRALACHRTQTAGLIVDAQAGFQIPRRLAALTARPTEVFLERR